MLNTLTLKPDKRILAKAGACAKRTNTGIDAWAGAYLKPCSPAIRNRHSRLPAILAALLLTGCAPAPRFHAGQALIQGETPVFPPAPDSLRCELELTAFVGGRKSSVTAAFSAKPGLSYKLDLFGLPGMVAGSFLWTPSQWTLVLFDREEYGQGAGEHVAIGSLGLQEVSVHDAFSFLWGDFFPGAIRSGASAEGAASGVAGDSAQSSSPSLSPSPAPGVRSSTGMPDGMTGIGGGVFVYPGRDARWRIALDPKTGLVREAAREDSVFRIEYGDYKRGPTGGSQAASASGGGERPVPRRVKLYRYREQILEIRVKGLEDNPHWRRDPFFVKIPKSFRRV
jgi:hypothetical protein